MRWPGPAVRSTWSIRPAWTRGTGRSRQNLIENTRPTSYGPPADGQLRQAPPESGDALLRNARLEEIERAGRRDLPQVPEPRVVHRRLLETERPQFRAARGEVGEPGI